MTALRSYILDDVTEIIVSTGENADYLHFGVTTEEYSSHFTLRLRSAEALEHFLLQATEEAGGQVVDRS